MTRRAIERWITKTSVLLKLAVLFIVLLTINGYFLVLKRRFYNFLTQSFYYIARSFKWYTKEIASR